MLRLLPGIHKFQEEIHSDNQEFFERLSKQQTPTAIFITCSDSRVDPNLLTMTNPGELFVLRNAGNIIPAYDAHIGGEEASIEFAVAKLGVRDIVVCGHSGCGAMRGLLEPELLSDIPAVSQWLENAKRTKQIVAENYSNKSLEEQFDAAVEENVLVQLENLRTLPCVARRLWKREIELHGWVYDIASGCVYVYDPVSEDFLAFHKFTDGYELVPGANRATHAAAKLED
jgi:carbonic anhydrase